MACGRTDLKAPPLLGHPNCRLRLELPALQLKLLLARLA
jgi:hypothetical protein